MADVERLPDATLDGDIAVLGRKGGGKTFTSKGIVERLLDLKRRVLILDPLGVWAGLRTSADGQSAGYPIAIFGGQHGDEPLDPAMAVPLAQVIATENMPAILDLSELTKSAQGTFLYRFLHELRRVNRDALTVVLEEADVFAPQNPQGDDSKLLHSEIDWISRRGRFRGFRLISITQRPARLSKDVLTQCATLIAHKLPAPQDREAVKAWVDGNGDRDLAKNVFDTLAGLAVGEAWVWSPENELLKRVRFPRIKTLDTSATPKAGESRIEPKTLAQVDLSGIRKALAEAKAARAADEGKPAKTAIAQPDAKAIAAAEARGFEEGRRTGYGEGFAAALDRIAASLGTEIEAMRRDVAPATALPPAKGDRFHGTADDFTPAPGTRVERISPKHVRIHADGEPPAAAKIMAAIDFKGAPPLTWTQIALLTGYSESGGQFRRGKKWLIDTGAVCAAQGDSVRIATPSKDAPAAPTGDALVALWLPKLPPAGRAILEAMWGDKGRARAGNAIAVGALAPALGYAASGGQWRRGVKALRDAQIVLSNGEGIAFAPSFLQIAGGGK